ncbi:MAG: lysophospholipid acyltransferase family protein [Gemmatimonadota bacterium]
MFYVRMMGVLGGFLLASAYGAAIALVRRDRSLVAHDYARALVRLIRPAMGVRVEVEGAERLERASPCIYVANHQSIFDVPILAAFYPPNTVVIGKKELRSIPFFGWLYVRTGNVLIDRSSNPDAVQRLRGAEAAIRERNVSVWIFPEGTRGEGHGQLLPFKKGAFYMAVAAQAPLVPIVVSPLRRLYDIRGRKITPGTVQVRVLKPIETRGLNEQSVPELIRRTHGAMQHALDELEGRRPEGRGGG